MSETVKTENLVQQKVQNQHVVLSASSNQCESNVTKINFSSWLDSIQLTAYYEELVDHGIHDFIFLEAYKTDDNKLKRDEFTEDLELATYMKKPHQKLFLKKIEEYFRM